MNQRPHRLRRPGLGALLLGLAVFSLAQANDWPEFLGPNRNGISAETGLAPSWPAAGPPVVWEKPVGAGYSAVAIAGNQLILFHRLDDKEVVQCLVASSGKPIWKYEYPATYKDDFGFDAGPRGTPLIAGNRVYTFGADGDFHCLDFTTGAKVWARNLNRDYQVKKGFFGVATSPLLDGSLLLINVGGKSQKAGIVALNKDTGKEVWRATDHEASYSSPVAATIDGVRHAFFFTREGLVSLDPADGAVRFAKRWRSRQQASVNAANPVVIDGHLFLSACYDTGAVLLRIRKDGCDEVWKSDEVLSNHYATSLRAGDFLYGIDGRQDQGAARLTCIEWKTGKLRWARERFGCGALLLADGLILGLTDKGELVLIEATPEAYREKARVAVLAKDCRAQLALADGRLVGRDGTKLVCWKVGK